MKIIRQAVEMTWDNPLVRWRFERSSAYTPMNLLLVLLILLMALFSWMRWDEYREMRRYVAFLPPEIQLYEKTQLFIFEYPSGVDGQIVTTQRERIAAYGQAIVIAAVLTLMFLRVVFTCWRLSTRWGGMYDDELRVLPLTYSQRIFFMFDLPLMKYLVVIVILCGLLLIPSRPLPHLLDSIAPYGWMSWPKILGILWLATWFLLAHRELHQWRAQKVVKKIGWRKELRRGAIYFLLCILFVVLFMGVEHEVQVRMVVQSAQHSRLFVASFYGTIIASILMQLYMYVQLFHVMEQQPLKADE